MYSILIKNSLTVSRSGSVFKEILIFARIQQGYYWENFFSKFFVIMFGLGSALYWTENQIIGGQWPAMFCIQFVHIQANSSQNSNADNYLPDLHNMFSKIDFESQIGTFWYLHTRPILKFW